jgi:hypothetical protein
VDVDCFSWLGDARMLLLLVEVGFCSLFEEFLLEFMLACLELEVDFMLFS